MICLKNEYKPYLIKFYLEHKFTKTDLRRLKWNENRNKCENRWVPSSLWAVNLIMMKLLYDFSFATFLPELLSFKYFWQKRPKYKWRPPRDMYFLSSGLDIGKIYLLAEGKLTRGLASYHRLAFLYLKWIAAFGEKNKVHKNYIFYFKGKIH